MRKKRDGVWIQGSLWGVENRFWKIAMDDRRPRRGTVEESSRILLQTILADATIVSPRRINYRKNVTLFAKFQAHIVSSGK
jgi:hypothetical protein